MKTKYQILILLLTILFIDATIGYLKIQKVEKNEEKYIFISYLEYIKYFKGNDNNYNKNKINEIINNISNDKINNIILHVSPFSDSIYNSKILPFTSTISDSEGKYQGFDYLNYFIQESHKKNIKIHAWINPYRISSNNDINKLSDNNPAKKLIGTSSVYIGSEIYYNPASEKVKNIILSYITELITNYDIDGINIDDYFYYCNNIDNIEYNNYIKNNKKISKEAFHLQETNDLIKKIYKLIKSYDPNIIFSISPDGNINNNYKYHFADVKTWLKSSEYVDIIIPQLYYGFKNDYLDYITSYKSWLKLIKNPKIKIVPALAIYKVGTIEKDLIIGKNEWIENSNIIAKQIIYSRNNYSNGYALFRYEYIYDNKNKNIKQELDNIKKLY